MSTITAEAIRISKIEPHSNADQLEIAHVQGWRCIVPKGRFIAGELVLYIPIDACLPVVVAEKIGVTKYLGRSNRVKPAKLRGETSFGIVVKPLKEEWNFYGRLILKCAGPDYLTGNYENEEVDEES